MSSQAILTMRRVADYLRDAVADARKPSTGTRDLAAAFEAQRKFAADLVAICEMAELQLRLAEDSDEEGERMFVAEFVKALNAALDNNTPANEGAAQ